MDAWIDTRTEREEMMDLMSDMSKDLYGFRVRYNFPEMSDDDMRAEIKALGKDLDAQLERELNKQKAAAEMYHHEIEALVVDHHISRKDALRWMMQAQKFEMSGMYSEKECVVEFLMMHVGLGTVDITEEVKRLDLSNEINFGY